MANVDLFSLKEKILNIDAVFEIINDKNRKLKLAEESSKKLLFDYKEECLKNERLSLEFSSYKKSTGDYMAKYIELKEKYDKLEARNKVTLTERACLQKLSEDSSLKATLVLKKRDEFCADLKKKILVLTSTVDALQENEKNLKHQLQQMGDLKLENEELKNKLKDVKIMSDPEENAFTGFSIHNVEMEFNNYINYLLHTDMLGDDIVYLLTNEMKTVPSLIKPITNPKEFKKRVNQGVQTTASTRIVQTQTETTVKSSQNIQRCEMQTQTCEIVSKRTINRDVQTDNSSLCQCGKIQDSSLLKHLNQINNVSSQTDDENLKTLVNRNTQTDPAESIKPSKSIQMVTNQNIQTISSSITNTKLNQMNNVSSQTNDEILKALVNRKTQTDHAETVKPSKCIQMVSNQNTQTISSSITNAFTQTVSTILNTTDKEIQTEKYNPPLQRRRISKQEAVATLKRANISITIKAGRVISYKLNPKRNNKNNVADVITKLYKLINCNVNPITKKKLQQRKNKLYLNRLKHSSTPSLMYDTDSSSDLGRPQWECELNSIDSGYIRSDCEVSVATTNTKSVCSTECNRKLDFADENYVQSLLDEMKPVPDLMNRSACFGSDEDEDYVNSVLKEMTQEIPILGTCISPKSKRVKRNDVKEDLGPIRKKIKETDYGQEIPLEVALDICDNVDSLNSQSSNSDEAVDKVPFVNNSNLEYLSLPSKIPTSIDNLDYLDNSLDSYKEVESHSIEPQDQLEFVPQADHIDQPMTPLDSTKDLCEKSTEKIFIPLNNDKKVLKKPTNMDRLKKLRKNLVKSNKVPIMKSDKVTESELVVSKKRIALLKSSNVRNNEENSLHLGSIVNDNTILDRLKLPEVDDCKKPGIMSQLTVSPKSDNSVKNVNLPKNLAGVIQNLGKKGKEQKLAEKRLMAFSDELAGHNNIDDKPQKKFKRPTRQSIRMENMQVHEMDKVLICDNKDMGDKLIQNTMESEKDNDHELSIELRLDKNEFREKSVENLGFDNQDSKTPAQINVNKMQNSNRKTKIKSSKLSIKENMDEQTVETAHQQDNPETNDLANTKITSQVEVDQPFPQNSLDQEEGNEEQTVSYESISNQDSGMEILEAKLICQSNEICDEKSSSSEECLKENENLNKFKENIEVSSTDHEIESFSETNSSENLCIMSDEEISCNEDSDESMVEDTTGFEESFKEEGNSLLENENEIVSTPSVENNLQMELSAEMFNMEDFKKSVDVENILDLKSNKETFKTEDHENFRKSCLLVIDGGEESEISHIEVLEKGPIINNPKTSAKSLSSSILENQEENNIAMNNPNQSDENNYKNEENLDVLQMPAKNTKKKGKNHLNSSYVLKIFTEMIHFRGETNKVEQSIQHLQKLDQETLLKYVLQVVKADNTEPERTESPFEPHLTVTQRVMIGFLLKLENEQIFVGTTNEFLTTCEKWLLFNETDVVSVHKVTKMYAAICKMKKDKRRLQRMICDALYFMGDLALPFVYHVLVSWIQVLPVEAQDSDLSDKPLIQVLVQVVHINGCKNPDYFMTVLKNLLTVYYKYPKERYDENTLMKQFLEKYICSLDEKFEMAILILCKQYKAQWCCKQFEIMRQMMLAAKTQDICTALVKLIKKIVRQFQNDQQTLIKVQTLLSNVYNDFPNFNLIEITPKIR